MRKPVQIDTRHFGQKLVPWKGQAIILGAAIAGSVIGIVLGMALITTFVVQPVKRAEVACDAFEVYFVPHDGPSMADAEEAAEEYADNVRCREVTR